MESNEKGGKIKATSKEEDKKFSVYTFGEVDLPSAIEKPHEKFITYGEDNLYPQMLIDAWLQSSTHNALTTGIVQMIAGEGLRYSGSNMEVEAFKMRINKNGDTLGDLINKTSFDLYLHGYYGWRVVWNKVRTKIVAIYHTPAETIRSGKADELGVIEDYYVSGDWGNFRKDRFKPKRVKAFDPSDRSEGVQMMFVKQYRPSQYYYSTPSYVGGMNWILMDNRVGEFHLNNIENGFFPSAVVQFFNGEPEQEAKRKLELNFMAKFTGKKQSKIVFVYNNNREEAMQFDTYETANIDKRFRDLMPEISKNIMISHRVPSPLLFGIREQAGFGNNAEELESSSLLMNKMVIIPMQRIMLNSLAEIFRINNWPVEVTIESLQPLQFVDGDEADTEATTSEDMSDDRAILPEKMVTPLLKHLGVVGTTIAELEEQGYKCVVDEEELTEEGRRVKMRPEMFAVTPDLSEVAPTASDPGSYIVRYQYRPGRGQAPIIEDTREFCSTMMTDNSDRVYSVDEINSMQNEEFGDYDIFTFKGSYNCRHRWARMVWFKISTQRGNVKGYRELHPDELPVGLRPAGDAEATKVNEKVS